MYSDNSTMTFGQHCGLRLKKVPADYLLWLYYNDKAPADLRKYIADNIDKLRKRAPERPVTDEVKHKARERGLKNVVSSNGHINKALITALDRCIFSSTRVYFINTNRLPGSARRDYSKELNLIFGLADVKMELVKRVPSDNSYYKISSADLAKIKALIMENTYEDGYN